MIFDNMKDEYSSIKKFSQRYEAEISDVYKSSSIIRSPKGKFKGLSVEAFSKVSAASKYHRANVINK